MAKVYRSAMGKNIDIDGLRLLNEHVIAIGNMKVNARGDELGPGGRIVKTRDQIMKEYYALNTPVATDVPSQATADPIPVEIPQIEIPENSGMDEIDEGPAAPFIPEAATPTPPVIDPVPVQAKVEAPIITPELPATAIRGSLASAVAKSTTVTQKEKLPPKKANGVQRF